MDSTTEALMHNLSDKDQINFIKLIMTVRGELEIDKKEFSDPLVLRFFKQSYNKPDQALEKIKASHEWRKTFPFENAAQIDPQKFIDLQNTMRMHFCGVDKQGRPIRITQVPNLDPEFVVDTFTHEEFLLHNIAFVERLTNIIFERCSQKAGKVVYQTLTIVDIKDFNINKFIFNSKVKDFISQQSKTFNANYPEMAAHVFVINAGAFMKILYNFLSVFLDKRVLERITILDGDYMNHLEKYVDKNVLPKCIGGGSPYTILEYPNFWDSDIENAMKEKRLTL